MRSTIRSVFALCLGISVLSALSMTVPVLPGSDPRSVAAQSSGCELVRNGDFEDPKLGPRQIAWIQLYGWGNSGMANSSGVVYGSFDDIAPVSGMQHVVTLLDRITQSLDVRGLGGQTLNVSLLLHSRPNFSGGSLQVGIGSTVYTIPASSALGSYERISFPTVVPTGSTDVLLALDANGVMFDAVSVIAPYCPFDAQPDRYAATGGRDLVVPAGTGLLANDGIPSGTGATAAAVSGTTDQGGTFEVAADGSFTYHPPDGFSGEDTAAYAVHAPRGSGTIQVAGPVTVTFDVTRTNRPPSFAASPSALTVEATQPSGAPVPYPIPSAIDPDPSDQPTVTCVPPPGDVFPLGETRVVCTATDSGDLTAQTTFDVTVRDTTAPAIAAPSDIIDEATSSAGATVAFPLPSASDAVDPSPDVTCTTGGVPVEPGATFPIGQSAISCSATDGTNVSPSTSFTVTIRDTTGPVITRPDDITQQATAANGAEVTFPVPTATDAVDGARDVSCTVDGVPVSPGAMFELGSTTVACSATDARLNRSEITFTITVQDTVAPEVTVPGPLVAEATSGNGAEVDFMASARDAVDGTIEPICSPSSGSAFAIGQTTVTCTATDSRDNRGSATFTVTVRDTLPPVFDATTLPGEQIEIDGETVHRLVVEATGAQTMVTYLVPEATDAVDGDRPVTCVPASGTRFELGETSVSCSAADTGGRTATAEFLVVITDTTAPVVSVPPDITAEATARTGARVTFAVSATDGTEGPVEVACAVAGKPVASPWTFPIGATTVACTATDTQGNEGRAEFTVRVVDSTGPAITWVGGPVRGATYAVGQVPAPPTCIGVDLASLVLQCQVTGYSSQPGRHVLTARARDTAGNVTVETRTYTVAAAAPPTVTPVPPRPTTPVVTPVPTRTPTVAPTRPVRTPATEPGPTPPGQPAPAPTRPPRR
ncbi:MAG TPA: HYR domain-containing protein [Thermomicrobiales bacterium]|jgi:hypothetical protein|nr:HYR domain-containing protein [Thermomicrobiales bacterium]